ncbi:MAG: hypothetical protein JW909_00475 [Planctomycetes bacterium]|nr:hypothetical protein [Planctomycetota bacterium]
MTAVGGLLIIAGAIVMLVGWIMILIKAFKASVGWGIASLLVGIVALVFAIMNWQDCKKAFLIWVVGFVVYIIGFAITLSGASSAIEQMPVVEPVGMMLDRLFA